MIKMQKYIPLAVVILALWIVQLMGIAVVDDVNAFKPHYMMEVNEDV